MPDLSADQLDRAVEIRIARQRVLTDENRSQLHAIIDEALLRRVVDSPDTMQEQLRHLLARVQAAEH